LVTTAIAENVCRLARLRNAFRRNFGVQFGGQNPPGDGVLEAVENSARNAERRRHDAARVARMHAFGQHVDRQCAAGESA
jgi:hypothetical protein